MTNMHNLPYSPHQNSPAPAPYAPPHTLPPQWPIVSLVHPNFRHLVDAGWARNQDKYNKVTRNVHDILVNPRHTARTKRDRTVTDILRGIQSTSFSYTFKTQTAEKLLRLVSDTMLFDYAYYAEHNRGYCPICHNMYFRELLSSIACTQDHHPEIQVLDVGRDWLNHRDFPDHFKITEGCPAHWCLRGFFLTLHTKSF